MSDFPIEPSFLVRPAPGRHEGPRGYLLRLAEANCTSVQDLESTGLRFGVASFQRHMLLPDPKLYPDLHQHVARMESLLAMGRIWNSKFARFCPDCLREDPRWRASWEILFHDVCPVHGAWLVDQCNSCGKPIKWDREYLLRCQCGSDLRQEQPGLAPENARRLSELLELRLLGTEESADLSEPLAGLDLEQTQRLIRYVGSYLDPAAGAKPLKLRNAGRMNASWPVSSLAAEILFQWPTSFKAAFSTIQELSVGVKTGLNGMLGQAHLYLYRGLHDKAFAPVHQAFQEWVAEFWKGGVAKRNRRLAAALLDRVVWIPGKVAADKLRISTKRLRSLIQEGLIEAQETISSTGRRFLVVRNDGLDQLELHLAAEMDFATAMKALGLCKVRMQQLVRLLFPNARRLGAHPRAPWIIPRDEVEALLAIGSALPVLSVPEENQVSVAHALRYWSFSSDEVVELVRAVKSEKLVPAALLNSARGIARWVFDANQLKSWQRGVKNPLRDWLANEDIARRFECRKTDAYWLVSNHFLEASRLRVHQRIGSRVHRTEIDRFLQRYIFVAEIAELLGMSSANARRLVEAQGFLSLSGTGPGCCHKAFFERTEQLMAALESLRHSKGGQLEFDGVMARSLRPNK